MGIGNLHAKKFKMTVIKLLTEVRREKMHEKNENINRGRISKEVPNINHRVDKYNKWTEKLIKFSSWLDEVE